MSKRDKAPPKRPPVWEDDDAHTVFDDSPLQTKAAQPTAAGPLPDLGSLTNQWREHTPPKEQHTQLTTHPLKGHMTPEQPGVFVASIPTVTEDYSQQTEPIVQSISTEEIAAYLQQAPAHPHGTPPRHTVPFGEDPITTCLTPDDILEEVSNAPVDMSRTLAAERPPAHTAEKLFASSPDQEREALFQSNSDPEGLFAPSVDEHPTSPGQSREAKSPFTTSQYHTNHVDQPSHASPLRGPGLQQQPSGRTSPYISAAITFPGDSPEEQRYELQSPIAKGGMSLISRAYDRFFLRHNAMKILDGKLAKDLSQVQRFLEEAQITGQLGHPNIVPVHDIGIGSAGQRFFTMKLINGKTLKEYLQEEPFSPDNESDIYRVMQIFLRICDAISYAHSRGVIHRDLKPSNIMVGSHGQVYVMDWGIAYLMPTPIDNAEGPIQIQRDPTLSPAEMEGDIVGTWNYMAPEQAQGKNEEIGVHTDIFALGTILYEILTDAPPYEHDSIYALLQKAQQVDYLPPQERVPHVHLPPGLCQIAVQAMAPAPTDRYESVEALQREIELFLRGGDQLPQRSFAPGMLIIEEGDKGHEAFVISRGHCRVFKTIEGRKVSLREMGPGEVFGETSIFLDQERTASVEAIDDVSLVIVGRDTLEQKLKNDTWLGRFVHTLANRFVEVDHKVTQLQQKLERAEISNLILMHLQTHGVPTSKGHTAAWAPLSDTLQAQLEMPLEDIVHTIQQLPAFQLELIHNQIILVRV